MAREHEENKKQEEFLRLYDDYADAIFRHCYLRLGDRERAKDLMQETFMRVWQYVADGTAISYGRALLYRISNNMIIDQYRKKKNISLDVLGEEGFDPPSREDADTIERGIDQHQVVKAIRDHLDPRISQVIVMRYVDGLTPKEIAGMIHETENAVSVRIHRGLKKIKELYTP